MRENRTQGSVRGLPGNRQFYLDAGTRMKDWNYKKIKVAQSRGGVIVTAHPYDNLIRPTGVSWPPPEIVQKLYQSRQVRAFDETNRRICISGLGYYCDLQSIHSEDAITWSVFGTVARSPKDLLTEWLIELLGLLDLHETQATNPEIFLWRRIPHPDTLVSGGPEIDVGILTENALILIEAKWQSAIGSKQGKKRNKDQIQLRGEFIAKYGSKLFPNRTKMAVVGISLFEDAFTDTTPEGVFFRSLMWEQICNLHSHPQAEELARYYRWKKEHTRTANNRLQGTANSAAAIAGQCPAKGSVVV